MMVSIRRQRSDAACSIGALQIDEFSCATLERPKRTVDPGIATRLPAGQYPLRIDPPHGRIAITGIDYDRNCLQYGNFVKDIDQFSIVVGLSAGSNFVRESQLAYDHIHAAITKAFERGEEVVLDLIDGDYQ